MKKQSNSFFVRIKNKITTFFKGEDGMLATYMRYIEDRKKPWYLTIKEEDYFIEESKETSKEMKFDFYKINPKVFLKNESPTSYKIRRDHKYNELKLILPNDKAMEKANKETKYYNKNAQAQKEVQTIKDEGIPKRAETIVYGERE